MAKTQTAAVITWTALLIGATLLAVAGGTVLAAWRGSASTAGVPLQPPADWGAPAINGGELTLADLRGRYVYLAFGYTHCTEICFGESRQLIALSRALRNTAATFVFVSIDPRRDTPAVLAAYFRAADGRVTVLRPRDMGHARRLAGAFGEQILTVGGPDGYDIGHAGRLYLIGPAGAVRRTYASNTVTTTVLLKDWQQHFAPAEGTR